MTGGTPFDDLESGLRTLGLYDARPEYVDRVRARCLKALAASRRRARPGSELTSGQAGWIEPVAVLGVGFLYVAAAVQASLVLLREL